MFDAEKGKAGKLDGKGFLVGIVQARWNESITNALFDACKAELVALGVPEAHIEIQEEATRINPFVTLTRG